MIRATAAQVISHETFQRKKKEQTARLATERKQPPASVRAKSNHDLYAEVFDDVISEWGANATDLNSYIALKLPKLSAKKRLTGDFIKDLNLISQVEQALKLNVSVHAPGTTPNNPAGWLASFRRGKKLEEVYFTSPDMANEAVARALNIVLAVSFEATLKSVGRVLGV